VWLLPQPTAASRTSAAVASRHLFIPFNFKLINLKVFSSYINSMKCISLQSIGITPLPNKSSRLFS
jgi:hypothetical protein